jgi:predicted RNA binding protein YcfA (HicA-like mRNA interferase family)
MLRSIPAARAIMAFEKAGFVVDRVVGSHYILTREGGPTFSIPRHGKVKAGLLLAKIKAAGLTYEEFEALI